MEEKRTIRIFIWLLCVAGMLIIFLSPPLTVPDENAHFLNAYCFSEGNLYPDTGEGITEVGKYVPAYIAGFIEDWKDKYTSRLGKKYSFKESFYDSWSIVSEEEREPLFFASALVSLNPWAYLFSGTAMRILSGAGRILGNGYDNGFNLIMAGRMGNFLFYVVAGYIAVSITPCLKKTMMMLLSMPMSLYLGASLSYDAILIPVAILLFAELMRLFMSDADEIVGIKDMVIVGVCAFFLIAIKMAYAPFLLFLLLIPGKKFRSVKQYITSIGLVVISGIIGGVLPRILYFMSVRGINQEENVNALIQKEYVFGHLWEIPVIIGRTIIVYLNFYISSFVGKIGTLDTNLPIPYILLFLGMFLLIALVESSVIVKYNRRLRIMAFVLVIFVITGMFVKMYLDWTPRVEAPMGGTVNGMQGRYFIPVFCFGCMTIFNNAGSRIHPGIRKGLLAAVENISFFWILINPCVTVLLLLLRYWC